MAITEHSGVWVKVYPDGSRQVLRDIIQKDQVVGLDVIEETANSAAAEAAKANKAAETAGKDAAAALAAGVSEYTHRRSGSGPYIHEFTGDGPNGRVKMTGNVSTGDKVTVNGVEVSAFVGTETFTTALVGENVQGLWLSFVYEGGQVNFKGGGGLTRSKLQQATAQPANVLPSATFYAGDKNLKTGTMSVTPAAAQSTSGVGHANALGVAYGAYTKDDDSSYVYLQATPDGQAVPYSTYLDGVKYLRASELDVARAAGLTANKLASGQTVLGVTGTGRARVETICTIGTENSSYTGTCNEVSPATAHMSMTKDGAARTVTFSAAGNFTWHTTGTKDGGRYVNSTYTAGLMNHVEKGASVAFEFQGGTDFAVLSVAFMPD